jgi:hypothetical protein
MSAKLCVTLVLIVLAIFSTETVAQESLALDSYTCAQFLSDSKSPADGNKLLKSLMMISWATGYASAFQQKIVRADAEAIVLIAATLGQVCTKSPEKKAVEAAVAAISLFGITEQTSAPPAPPSTGGAFAPYDNYDLFGRDLRGLQGVEQQSCSAACMDEPLCQAYSYDKWNKYCYLKNAAGPLTLDAGSITGVRDGNEKPTISGTKIRLERRSSKRFSGGPFRTPYKATLDACQSTCEDNAKCLGYTFSTRTDTCNLFESITKFVSDETATSAFKTQNPP